MSVQRGELVMVPFWGPSEVTGASRETVLGNDLDFCHLRPLHLRHSIRIPRSDLAGMGVRPLLSGRQMSEIIFLGKSPQGAVRPGARGSYESWVRLLRSGLPGVRPWILRQMGAQVRPLGPRESQLRETIRQNFREEIRLVFGCSRRQAAAYARKALA